MAFLLCVAWLFLCKNCVGEKQLSSHHAKIRRGISKESRAPWARPLLARLGVIKMLFAHESQQTAPNHRAEPVEIWKARKFIEEHSGEEISLRRVAKAVNNSPNHLSEKFKQVTGINFVEYIARTRFENACDLLRNPNLRISEIAFATGFQSLSQFNRVFKRISRKSPSQYRDELSGRGKS
jgi:AraC-like DNA-binding protein